MVDLKEAPSDGIRPFIELSKLLYEGDLPYSDKIIPSNVRLIDPWGNAYVYAYKESEEWDNFSFVLYSKGSDGADVKLEADGVLSTSFKNLNKNMDNIYLED